MSEKSALINEMINYYAGDVKRINHFMKVYSFAKTIGELEKIDSLNQEVLEIVAIIHDIGIKLSEQKYKSSSGKYQEMEGPAIARELLEKLNYKDTIISRVCFIVGHHHTYKAIDGIDFQILVEADFLVNIWEEGLSHNSICEIRNSTFKSKAGIVILEQMYLL